MTAIAQELSQAVGISQACQTLDVPRSRLYPRQHASVSPKYASTEDCEADFGTGKCESARRTAGDHGQNAA